jgi:hypothetical protein
MGAVDVGKLICVAADTGVSASAETSALRTVVVASRATADRKNRTCRIIEIPPPVDALEGFTCSCLNSE